MQDTNHSHMMSAPQGLGVGAGGVEGGGVLLNLRLAYVILTSVKPD